MEFDILWSLLSRAQYLKHERRLPTLPLANAKI